MLVLTRPRVVLGGVALGRNGHFVVVCRCSLSTLIDALHNGQLVNCFGAFGGELRGGVNLVPKTTVHGIDRIFGPFLLR